MAAVASATNSSPCDKIHDKAASTSFFVACIALTHQWGGNPISNNCDIIAFALAALVEDDTGGDDDDNKDDCDCDGLCVVITLL